LIKNAFRISSDFTRFLDASLNPKRRKRGFKVKADKIKKTVLFRADEINAG